MKTQTLLVSVWPPALAWLAVLAILIATATPAPACIALAPVTYVGPVYTEAERAVIVWDKAHHLEHFIRQASVHAGDGEMAFLVPTPETPQMGDVDPALYSLADNVARPTPVPPIQYETPWDIFAPYATILRVEEPSFDPTPVIATPPKPAALHPKSGPAILEQDVAGYHVTVLATEDYPAIAAWLAKNGYRTTPAVEAWIKSYAARHWKINAFRLIKAQENGDGTLTTPPLRLTFHTDAPYYPYSEPADRQLPNAASPGGRILTVAILSDERMAGKLADGYEWPGQLRYAGPSSAQNSGDDSAAKWLQAAGLADGPSAMTLPARLTTFVDDANPRHGTADLYFSPATNQGFYRGTEADYSLPPVRRLDWGRPVSLLTGFAAMLLVPGAPLYCGCRMLQVARRRRDARTLVGEAIGWRVADKALGLAAFFVGLVASIPCGFALLGGIVGVISGEPEGIPMLMIGAPALLACIGTVHCGRRAMFNWTSPRRLRSRSSLPRTVPAAEKPLDVPVLRMRYDIETGVITGLEKSSAPFKRYERVMAVGSVTCGAVVLIAVATIFLTSGTI
jgi:hypothetical protein